MAALLNVARKGLKNSSADEVVTAAVEVWHKRYLPNLSGLSVDEQRVAGYLVDRLSRFNCLSLEQKKLLQGVAAKAKQNVPKRVSHSRVDALAKNWGLEEDLKPFMPALMPYQTRHYKRDLDRSAA
ncbi:hypothetical protein [Marinobacter alexandrii]|jgi:hypothetical protein|uniref:hypothetical protein n=1 Tax=Marinobacter alexandrii TaxID=2570351 RepID=UPI002ABD9DAA|nr:hypothetical protein [Marinobacter alexandrii]